MEQLKHECGVAMIRLLKPLDYYQQKYGTWRWGLNKLYLLMEKQHNRGQEGAGAACVNLDAPAGEEYMFREKALGKDAISEIFRKIGEDEKHFTSSTSQPFHSPFAGQLYMGHLRYSTTGKSGLQYVHPFLRRNNWRAKNLCLCGNFNMTNIDEVFQFLTQQGQSPRIYGDAYITLELMGHRLDREVERLFSEAKEQGLTDTGITAYIETHVEMANVLRTTMSHYDGGYVMCGITGSGEMFAVRDPWGIRPAFYYQDDEVVVVASERPVIQTTFDLTADDIHELPAGQALIVRKDGHSHLDQILPPIYSQPSALNPKPNFACSFERIYFSRGSDRDIYQERKRLGEQLTPAIMKAIDGDVPHTVFSYIPNTAEVAFHGMT
ncbi:MAG: amidophosphoribosyltransferase, partial [Bacteroidaceae bacterium]|nr:amidophosphoribosyltransferase [Bacteroidaceae bacterium]